MIRLVPAPRLLAAVALLTGVAACSRVQLSAGPGAGLGATATGGRLGGRTVPVGRTGADSSIFARGRDRRVDGQGGAEGVRRACRSGAWPRGWVAVAYERGGDGCPGAAAGDSLATTAVLVRHTARPLGTRLDVCADQPVPAGWARVDDEAPDAVDACPGAERGDRPGVRRIARLY